MIQLERDMKKLLCGVLATWLLIFLQSAANGAGTPGAVKWTYNTGSISDSSPAIGADGTIYAGLSGGDILALKPDGTYKWIYKTDCNNVGGSPAIGADGTIYTFVYLYWYAPPYLNLMKYQLVALKPDGTLKWTAEMGFHSNPACSAASSSPAVGPDGTIYVGTPDGWLYAINPDGTFKWHNDTSSSCYASSPAIAADGTIYIGSYDGPLLAFKGDGTLKWFYGKYGKIVSSPAIGTDGTIYIGSGTTALYAINPGGTLKWSFVADGYIQSSPAIGADGTIYVGSDHNSLLAVHQDGTLKWSFPGGGAFRSSPAIGSDGTIYAGTMWGYTFYAINPDGTLKWSVPTGDQIGSSPAIGADGTVYFGSEDKKLYALYSSSSGLAKSAWPMFHHDVRHTGLVPSPTLTVYRSGKGAGAVTSTPSGINCGSTCVVPFFAETTITLTATPSPNSTFAGWSGACTGTGTCKVTLKDAASVTASFVLKQFTVSASVPGGHGKATPASQNVNYGSTASITVTADAGYHIENITDNGVAKGVATTYTIANVTAAHTVAAAFTNKYLLTVYRSGKGGGAVTSTPSGINCGTSCVVPFTAGTTITLTATPFPNSTFAGWSGACTGTGTCKVTLKDATSVIASFVLR